MFKSRRMRWAGHVAHMGRRGMRTGFSLENQNETDHQEVPDVGGRIIVKWILQEHDRIIWTGLIWLRIGTRGGLM
jgi:hypothetical protein